jgi:fatty acid synthase subunit beta
MLGNINSSLIDRLIQRVYNGDVSKIPTIDYLGPKPEALPKLTGFAKV